MVEQRRRAVFNWSGGKDSALALQTVLREDRYEVVSLLTTVDASNDRSSMHGIPAELLRMQADSIGLPIRIVPTGKGIEDYERAMAEAVGDFVARGAEHFIFAGRARVPGASVGAVWRDGGRAAVGTGAGTDYGRFSRLGTRNGRCNDRCFLPRCRLDRADDRRNVSRRFARRCRSVRRERRISYVLPCGRNVPLSDSVPFGRACPPELHGDARRRCGEVLRLLVRRSDGSLDRSIFLSVR